jgi:5-formyltetrahydrofolate cyclo-ligase
MSSDTIAEKKALRAAARARRAELARVLPDFGERIASFVEDLALAPGTIAGGYRALPDEADPLKLADALRTRGCEVAYPRVHANAQPLWFHVPVAGEPWLRGAYGVLEPRADWPRAFPAVLLVPLLAFDAEGYRLGYGGGYYDRTLQQFRAERTVNAIGVAFAGQEVPAVPHDAGDERLDMVVTEQGVRRFPKA